MVVLRHRIAIPIDGVGDGITNVLTGRSIAFYRASKVRFEVGLLSAGAIAGDLSGVAQIGIGFKSASDPCAEAYLSGPWYAPAINVISQGDWDSLDSSKFNAAIDLLPYQTEIGIGRFDALLVVFIVDSNAVPSPVASIPVTVLESGIGGAPSPGVLPIYDTGSAIRFSRPLQFQWSKNALWYQLDIIEGEDGNPAPRLSDIGQI
jgi:hypothetical protein